MAVCRSDEKRAKESFNSPTTPLQIGYESKYEGSLAERAKTPSIGLPDQLAFSTPSVLFRPNELSVCNSSSSL